MIRTHPQWLRAKSLVDEGRLGEVRAMTGFFSYFNVDPGNVRNVREYGGGGLLDIGCYLVNTSRFIFGAEPSRIAGTIDCDPATGVDRLASMLLDFDGRHAIGTCSTQVLYYQRIQIVGTKGRLEIEIPFNAPSDGMHAHVPRHERRPVRQRHRDDHDSSLATSSHFSSRSSRPAFSRIVRSACRSKTRSRTWPASMRSSALPNQDDGKRR